jgi:hypothetical protein
MQRGPDGPGAAAGHRWRVTATDALVDPREAERKDPVDVTAQHRRDAHFRPSGDVERWTVDPGHEPDDHGGDYGEGDRPCGQGERPPAGGSNRTAGSVWRGRRCPIIVRRLERIVDRGRPLAPEVLGSGRRLRREGRQARGLRNILRVGLHLGRPGAGAERHQVLARPEPVAR